MHAKGVELLNSHDLKLTIDDLIEFKKESSVKETEKDIEPMKKIMTVAKLSKLNINCSSIILKYDRICSLNFGECLLIISKFSLIFMALVYGMNIWRGISQDISVYHKCSFSVC